jgi:formiminotetrahydrofolate cyclodeaminase
MLYRDRSIRKYLDDLAARTPAPGGGSAAALSSAIGCALLSMCANFTIGKEKYKEYEKEIKKVLRQSEKLRRRFLELMDLDVKTYTEYSYAKNKSVKQKAKLKSQKVVKEITSLCYKAMDLCILLTKKGNINLINDVLAAAELILAGFNSALINVER